MRVGHESTLCEAPAELYTCSSQCHRGSSLSPRSHGRQHWKPVLMERTPENFHSWTGTVWHGSNKQGCRYRGWRSSHSEKWGHSNGVEGSCDIDPDPATSLEKEEQSFPGRPWIGRLRPHKEFSRESAPKSQSDKSTLSKGSTQLIHSRILDFNLGSSWALICNDAQIQVLILFQAKHTAHQNTWEAPFLSLSHFPLRRDDVYNKWADNGDGSV